MKLSLILLFVLVVSVSCGDERDEIDSQVEKVSDFLLDLIAKYDQSGMLSMIQEQAQLLLKNTLIFCRKCWCRVIYLSLKQTQSVKS